MAAYRYPNIHPACSHDIPSPFRQPTAYFCHHQSATGTHAQLNTPTKHEATVEWLMPRLSLGRCPVQISSGTSNILNKVSSAPPCNFRSSASKYDTKFSKSYQIYHPPTALLIDGKQSLILTAKLNNNQIENTV
jgi:hypothetical protein